MSGIFVNTHLSRIHYQGLPPANMSSDCLTINIFRPVGTSAETKLPVMLWIHGGKPFSCPVTTLAAP